MSRDMLWYELFERMQDNHCPICSLLDKMVDGVMESFLYESVNNPGLRDKIKKAHGLCYLHSKMMMEKGDPLAHALVYSDLIIQAIDEISKKNINAFAAYDKHDECIFCQNVNKSEAIYAKAFLSAYQDKEFEEKYLEEGLLCMSHVKLIHENTSKSQMNILNSILKVTEDKCGKLVYDLSEIKRKNDYRYKDEEWTESERKAWKKAVAVINKFDVLKNK